MKQTLGEIVAMARKAKAMSMEAVAVQIGATKAFISLLEKNQSGISNDKLTKLSAVLGLDAATLVTLRDEQRGEKTAPWLKYLIGRYQPSEYVIGICKKFITDSGLSENATKDEEDSPEFRARWDLFYSYIKKMLDDPNIKIFGDEKVRSLVRNVGLADCGSWMALKKRISQIVDERLGDARSGVCNTEEWREIVASKLHIETVRLNSGDMTLQLLGSLSTGAGKSVWAGMMMVASTPKLYGAVYKAAQSEDGATQYVFVEDLQGDKGNLKSEPFWHEAARVLVDPDLKLGHGCEYRPDGSEFDAFDFALTRIAGWLALGFDVAERSVEEIVADREILCPDLPIRFATEAIIDNMDYPLIYLDCYKRLKHTECEELKISKFDLAAMRQDPAAKLRIGCVFANVAAATTQTNLRFNQEVSASSLIYSAYETRKRVSGIESLSDWDSRYKLTGKVKTMAVYSSTGHDNVRAIMEII